MLDAARIKLSRSNIVAALSARGKSSFEVSVSLGKNRTYIDDYIKGRKASISIYFSQSLAEYLEVHRSYIEGRRALPTAIDDVIPARGAQASSFNLENSISELDEKIRLAEKGSFGLLGKKVDLDRLAELKALRENLMATSKRSKDIEKILSEDIPPVNKDAEAGWRIPYPFSYNAFKADPRKLIVIAIEDNSMKSIVGEGFSHGERLIIDTGRIDFRHGGPFAIRYEGVVLVRLVEQSAGATGTIFIGKPLNAHFPTIDLGPTPDEQIVGRVVGQIRPV